MSASSQTARSNTTHTCAMGIWVTRTDLPQNHGLLFTDGVVLLSLHALDRDSMSKLHVQRSALRHQAVR